MRTGAVGLALLPDLGPPGSEGRAGPSSLQDAIPFPLVAKAQAGRVGARGPSTTWPSISKASVPMGLCGPETALGSGALAT